MNYIDRDIKNSLENYCAAERGGSRCLLTKLRPTFGSEKGSRDSDY